jgi:acetyl esterase/lipase
MTARLSFSTFGSPRKAGDNSTSVPAPPLAEIVKMRAVLRLPGADDVPVRRDLVYKEVAGVRLELDLYRPASAAHGERLPLVVLIHGGPIPEGSRPKEWGTFDSIARLVAVSGLSAIAFNHRFHAPALLVEAAGDLRDLLRYAAENAAGLGVDPERVALWAFSGGGPFLSSALREGPAGVRALVAYYALLDLRERPPGLLPGGPNDLTDETRAAYSPAYHVATSGRPVPPLLVARAGQDHPWLNGAIDRFVAAALARNAPLDLLNHPAGHHGFDVLDDDERSREILRRTLEFLRGRLLY